jgi:fibronectin type 3 domain-containing protein
MKNIHALLIVICCLLGVVQAQAQTPLDSMVMVLRNVTSAYTTPRGVAIVARMHIPHPESKHPLKYRGYHIYRKDLGSSTQSEQELAADFIKRTGKKPSGNPQQDTKDYLTKLPFKRLTQQPLTALTNPKELVEKIGVEQYTRLMRDLGTDNIDTLYARIQRGDENLAIYGATMNPRLGEALGMIFYDANVQKGNVYAYVSTAIREDFSEADTTSIGVVIYGNVNPAVPRPAFDRLFLQERAIQPAGDSARIINAVQIKALPKKAGYYHHVLRASDSLGSYTPITHLPFLAMVNDDNSLTQLATEDTTVVTAMTYYYTVAAEDIWGNRAYSDTMKITVLPPLPPIPQDLKAESTRDGIKLSWKPIAYEYLAGFYLYKKINPESDTIIAEKISTRLIPAHVQQTMAEKVQAGKTYEFVIVAVDKFGQESRYSAMAKIQFENLRPPLPPVNLRAVHDTVNRVIRLTWDSGTEADLAGYSVYRSQNPKQEPLLMTANLVRSNAYTDTSQLAKNATYYYYVRSMNFTGYQSPLSDYAAVVIKTFSKPERVNSLSGKAEPGIGYTLTWNAPLDQSVSKVRLYRRTKLETIPTLLYEERVSGGKYVFKDKTATAGIEHIYTLRGVNEANMESDDSAPVKLFSRPEPLLPPDRLSIEPQANGALLLKWVPKFADNLAGYHVYRTNYKDGLKRLTDEPVPKNAPQFLDTAIAKGEIYHYYIQSVDAQGFEGKPSEQVRYEVIIPEN